jgi:hypothetical protein
VVVRQGVLWQVSAIPELVDGHEVHGKYGTVHCVSKSPDGRNWIRKRAIITGENEIVAESISWLLAKELGVPVPDAGMFLDAKTPHENSWLSHEVPAVVHWDPDDAGRIENIEDLGGILTLDSLTLNLDRHEGNLLVEAKQTWRLHLWAIDSGNALVGQPPDFAARCDEILQPDNPPIGNLARGPYWTGIRNRAMEVATAIAQLPATVLQRAVATGSQLGRETRGAMILQTLHHRSQRIVDLTGRYLDLLERRP